jgi:hypothetical protein
MAGIFKETTCLETVAFSTLTIFVRPGGGGQDAMVQIFEQVAAFE